jgi:hypothetical protein
LLSTHTQRWRPTQSETSKRETFFNQQPANLQAEVCSYVLYKYNKYSYKRLIRGCLFTIDKSYIGDRQNPTNVIFIYLLFTYGLYNDADSSSENIALTQEYHYALYSLLFNIKEIKFCPRIAFTCLARFWDETAIASLNSVNRLILVTEMKFPYCEA